MHNLSADIHKAAIALTSHSLQQLIVESSTGGPKWSGDADNSTWSSACHPEPLSDSRENSNAFQCNVTGRNLCLSLLKNEYSSAR